MKSTAMTRRDFLVVAGLAGAALLAGCAGSGTTSTSSTASSGTDASSSSTSTSTSASTTVAEPGTNAGKTLVAYFSGSGHTRAVAQEIADHLGADIFEVTPAQPYTTDDLDFNDANSRVSQKHEDESKRNVELAQVTPDGFDGYQTVFVGYPIWWMDAAWPIDNFVSGNDFTGKTIIPFCTSLSSSLGRSGENLATLAGTGNWQEGHRFGESPDASEVDSWVDSLGVGAAS